MKHLIIAAVGDGSLHKEWISGHPQYDVALIYYGGNDTLAEQYAGEVKYFTRNKGQKYFLVKTFLKANPNLLDNYDYVWLPDDDVSIGSAALNSFFDIAIKYNLYLCQPAMTGYVSHKITKPRKFTLLRYTNFVEVLAPLMKKEVLLTLMDSFDINESAWGFEFLWAQQLGNPKNKIAIIDAIKMRHTRPVGTDYSRFKIHPWDDLKQLNEQYQFGLDLKKFKRNFKVHKRLFKLFA